MMRQLWIICGLVVCGALAVPAHAAAIEVSVERDHRAEKSVIGTTDERCDQSCPGNIQITRGGKPAFHEDFSVGSSYSTEPGTNDPVPVDYQWSCRRTGIHRYRVTVEVPAQQNAQPGEEGYDYNAGRTPVTKEGTFRVPGRCGRWRGMRVSRGYAAARAARLYDNEFVSRVRCKPRSRARRGRAVRWGCQVTHNNTYRECVTPERLSFRKRSRFGRVQRDYSSGGGRRRCRSF